MSYPEKYLAGIQLFNAGDYFESHEVWEDLWRATAGYEREFYKGLIQIAVGLCHYCNGNARGAARMYFRGTAYLSRYRPHCQGLDLDDFLGRVERIFAPALAAEERGWLSEPLSQSPRIVLDPEPEAWPAVFHEEDEE